ncbi:MAG: ATP-binding cassette domain-containing protein [Burkholderiaceae bacterium]|nr:ATP-binding cassette domain-containing protein [Burkholderiaceae bacterium]
MKHNQDTTSFAPLLTLDHLRVDFQTRHGVVHAVQDISLSLSRGETLGIVGESGSGKSVTSYALMGLLDRAGRVTSGRAVYSGIDLLPTDESTMRDIRGREISMIFQNPRAALNPIRTVGDQIADVLLQHNQCTRQNARSKAIEALANVQIRNPDQRVDAYPFELSAMSERRLSLICSLTTGNPKREISKLPPQGDRNICLREASKVGRVVVGLCLDEDGRTRPVFAEEDALIEAWPAVDAFFHVLTTAHGKIDDFHPILCTLHMLEIGDRVDLFHPFREAMLSVRERMMARFSSLRIPVSSYKPTTKVSRDPNVASILLFVSTTGALVGMNASVDESTFSLPIPKRPRTETTAHTAITTASLFLLYPIPSL